MTQKLGQKTSLNYSKVKLVSSRSAQIVVTGYVKGSKTFAFDEAGLGTYAHQFVDEAGTQLDRSLVE